MKSFNKTLKKLPVFKSEKDEVLFWENNAITDFYDLKDAIKPFFPNLKLSTKVVTFRATSSLLDSLKMLANQKDVPYQSLMKIYLDDRVKKEFAKNYKTA